MDFRRQRYFLAVAQHLGFRRAADALNVSQPALSQQIRLLEEDLGLVLFERSGREIKLTAAGTEYYNGVQALMSEMNLWVRRARDAQEGQRGTLTIGVNAMMLVSHLPLIIGAFREKHPHVRLNVSVIMAPETLRALRSDRIDLALTAHGEADDEIAAELLWTFPWKVVLPRNHARALDPEVRLSELFSETLLKPSLQGSVIGLDDIRDLCIAHGLRPAEIREVPGDSPAVAIMGLISCGLGFTIMSSVYARMKPDSVIFKPIANISSAVQVSACWRIDDKNPLINKFMPFARDLANTCPVE